MSLSIRSGEDLRDNIWDDIPGQRESSDEHLEGT